MVVNKRKFRLSLNLLFVLGLAGCNGGGSDSTSSADVEPNSTNFQVSGTVPGTLIEGYCDDGSYHSTHSINDGSSRHPFTLSLPKNVGCRLVMSTNEESQDNKVVVPLRFRANNGVVSSILHSAEGNIDFGYIDLPLSRAAMSRDDNNDGVEDQPIQVVFDVDQAVGLSLLEPVSDALDIDRDGIPNIYEDDDGDGLPNRDDLDDDGDGLDDSRDNDHINDLDQDGIPNEQDVDDDNDGVNDTYDADDDNDGVRDEEDDDDDNDGVMDDDDADDHYNGNPNVSVPDGGRLLASQCFQCHGTDGNSSTGIDSLAGESVAEIVDEMLEMQIENDNELMHYQARGYNNAQIQAIAAFFATQSRVRHNTD